MGAVNLTMSTLGICFLLLLIPGIISLILELKILKEMIISAIRMSLQLILIGIFLQYIFDKNNALINLTWVLVMIGSAVFSVIRSSQLRPGLMLLPAMGSFCVSTFLVVFYLNCFVVRIENLLDARYLVVISGMLLGNTLRGNIIGLTSFYQGLRKEREAFQYRLSLGANLFEGIKPYLKNSMILSLKPTLASMATMGLVSLPGMMTGNILGGTSPAIAIKYQIMIMIAIFTATTLSVLLTILTTLPGCFSPAGNLKEEIFSK